MDTQNTPPQPPVAGGQQPAAPQPQPQPQQPQTSPAVSYGGNKEHAPSGATAVDRAQPAPVEAVPQIPKELQELGIETSPDPHTPSVAADVRQAGVTPVKTAVPAATVTQVPQQPQVQIPTPVNYQQAMQNLRDHKADESISWLSMLSKYILVKLGMEKAP